MNANERYFNTLVREAWDHDFSGWDFTYISQRMLQDEPSWDFHQLALEKIKTATSLLDLDTGGGEFLLSLQPLPQHTCATEAYPPNVTIAQARLEPLGVQVCVTPANRPLPFADNAFDLIIDRHGDFSASEILRILRPRKSFITQQVGGRNNIDLNEILQDQIEPRDLNWTLDAATEQLEENGFSIVDRREEFPAAAFLDVGAVVYYLKAIPWQVNDFSIEKYHNGLMKIHNIIQNTGKFMTTSHRFYLEANKQ